MRSYVKKIINQNHILTPFNHKERKLAILLSDFSYVLEKTRFELEPAYLAHYLYKLCSAFNATNHPQDQLIKAIYRRSLIVLEMLNIPEDLS